MVLPTFAVEMYCPTYVLWGFMVYSLGEYIVLPSLAGGCVVLPTLSGGYMVLATVARGCMVLPTVAGVAYGPSLQMPAWRRFVVDLLASGFLYCLTINALFRRRQRPTH